MVMRPMETKPVLYVMVMMMMIQRKSVKQNVHLGVSDRQKNFKQTENESFFKVRCV